MASRNEASANDLTQDAFLQAFRKLHTFRSESAFSTWLYRPAFNVVLMSRRRKKVKETSLEQMLEIESKNPLVKQIGRTDQYLSRAADRIFVKRALKQLPRDYRNLVLLHDLLGYEHKEIGEALGRSSGACKAQLHRARIRLCRILKSLSATKRSQSLC